MRVALFLPKVPGYSETFFRNKIHFLIEAGFSVLLVAPNPERYKIPGVEIRTPLKWESKLNLVSFISGLIAIVWILVALRKSLRFCYLERKAGLKAREVLHRLLLNANLLTINADWIHFGYATMSIGRENLAQVLGAKMAVSLRGYDIGIYPIKNPDCYKLLWPRVDKIHTISDDLVIQAQKFGLTSLEKVVKIPPAIDTSRFLDKHRNGKISKPLRILTIGRLHWKKGLDYTLTALSILDQQGVDFRYTIIGKGEDEERLRFAAYQLGISDKVIFAGVKPHHEIPEFLSHNDFYIQYSIQEGFCNAVLEAQCNGLINFVSDAEGLSENVLHGETGFVVSRRNPKALANKILEVISFDDEARKTIASKAQRRVTEFFDLNRQQEQFVSFYES